MRGMTRLGYLSRVARVPSDVTAYLSHFSNLGMPASELRGRSARRASDRLYFRKSRRTTPRNRPRKSSRRGWSQSTASARRRPATVHGGKGTGSSCIPELIPVLGSQLAVARVIKPAVGCRYFPPGLQLPSQPLRGLLPISLLGEQRHDGRKVNGLPKTVIRQRRGCDLNPCA